MSTKPEEVETTGKATPPPPPKPAGPAVIRRTEVAEEDAGQRVLNRHVPAWVISGAVHVVVIGMAVLFMSGPEDAAANTNDLVTTQVEEPKEDDNNLTNEDVGFDADLPAATDSKLEETRQRRRPGQPERIGRAAGPAVRDGPADGGRRGQRPRGPGSTPTLTDDTGSVAAGVGGGGGAFTPRA